MNKEMFVKKMKKQLNQAMAEEKGRYTITVTNDMGEHNEYNSPIVVYITDWLSEMPREGRAICDPADTFDLELGIAIAWAKLTKQEVPKSLLRLKAKKLINLNPGDRFVRYKDFADNPSEYLTVLNKVENTIPSGKYVTIIYKTNKEVFSIDMKKNSVAERHMCYLV